MDFLLVQTSIMVLTIIGLRQIQQFTCRRSMRREHMIHIGGALIIVGSIIRALGAHDAERMSTVLPYIGQYIVACGYFGLGAGIIGWDRMALHVPSWWGPVGTSIGLGLMMLLNAATGWIHWQSLPTFGIFGVLMLLDLSFMGHSMAYRRWLIVPFLLLHLCAAGITMLAELNGLLVNSTVMAWLYTNGMTAVLFAIVAVLLHRGDTQRRMLII